MARGLFISIEGIDGSGKSTQLEHLTKRLDLEGIQYLLNREPGGSAVGMQIRRIVLDPKNPVSPTAELLLYFANRAQNVDEQIRPALEQGPTERLSSSARRPSASARTRRRSGPASTMG